MKTILLPLLFSCVVLAGCSTTRGIGSGPDAVPNGCVVQCVYAAQRFAAVGIKSRILGIGQDRRQGHAVTAFWYRGGTYIYDPARGTAQIFEKIEKDPKTIAYACAWFRPTDARYLGE